MALQSTDRPSDGDLISIAGLSPLIIDRLADSVLKHELSEILDPAGRTVGSVGGFDNRSSAEVPGRRPR